MKTAEAIDTALNSGADFIGFIHYPKSSRYISFEYAASLSQAIAQRAKTVAVLVNPTDDDIAQIVALGYADYLQLHGDERPERVCEVKELSGLPVIKALGIASERDLFDVPTHEALADMLLLDAKSPEYGGAGQSFDWSLLQGMQFQKPWFLSGGLDAYNARQAMRETGAHMIDVSSGLEREKGVKDIAMIEAFNKAARAHEA